jgi:hypothetical protein
VDLTPHTPDTIVVDVVDEVELAPTGYPSGMPYGAGAGTSAGMVGGTAGGMGSGMGTGPEYVGTDVRAGNGGTGPAGYGGTGYNPPAV